jgi:hypothetical protein
VDLRRSDEDAKGELARKTLLFPDSSRGTGMFGRKGGVSQPSLAASNATTASTTPVPSVIS